MRLVRVIFAVLLLLENSLPAFATNYFVDIARADDSGNGLTPATAKKTLSAGHTLMSGTGGDNLYITGLHDVEFTVTKDGAGGVYNNYIFSNAIVRKILLDRVDYSRFICPEITHTNTTFNDGIVFNDHCNFIEIWDANIHDIHATHGGIVGASGNQPNLRRISIRNATVRNLGIVNGSVVDDPSAAIGSMYEVPFTSTNVIKADHWLLDHCTFEFVGDGTTLFGTNNIARNLSSERFDNNHWSLGFSFHSDNFQPGSDQIITMSRLQIYERIWAGDQVSADSHFGIIQDTMQAGDTDFLLRGLVGFNMDGGVGVISAKKVRAYNNTFYGMSVASPWFNFYSPGTNTDYSTGSYVVNSIAHTSSGLTVDAGNVVTTDHNLGFNSGAHASYISTSDPLFVSPSTTNSRNFRLQASSPARGVGASPITITSATGSGTTFNVNDGGLLCDGWGLADGDTVTINATTTRVTAISGNAVTVAASVSWTLGNQVHWGKSTTEDLGALPFASVELTAATISNVGTTYTVTPTGDAEGVWFYENGLPTTWDNTPPYQITSSAVVSAKVYAFYAQKVPVIAATAGGGGGPVGARLSNASIRKGFGI